jgi:hypothetical protein
MTPRCIELRPRAYLETGQVSFRSPVRLESPRDPRRLGYESAATMAGIS